MKWGYKRAFFRCALLFVAGAALQFISGRADGSFLSFPWGAVIALNYAYILVLFVAKSDKWKWVRKLYDHYAYTSALASMVVMTIIFGLTPQDASTDGLTGMLGFRNMVSSWSFNLLLIYFITMLGLKTVEDIWNWRKRRIIPLLIHFAVFIVLAAGLLSSGDKERIRVNLPIGYPVHSGISSDGTEVHLPFVITLKDFIMEEYPPKIHLVDISSGKASEEYIYVEDERSEGTLGNWHITVKENLDMAGCLDGSSGYIPMEHVGAAPAAYVKAKNTRTGKSREGWISCGSHIFSPAFLELSGNQALAMPEREARRFFSEIIVENDKGKTTLPIEVNKPARVGPWKIYQVSYDSIRGRWSTTSVLECVKDGWYPIIQTGLWLILVLGFAMAVTAGGKRIRTKEENR